VVVVIGETRVRGSISIRWSRAGWLMIEGISSRRILLRRRSSISS